MKKTSISIFLLLAMAANSKAESSPEGVLSIVTTTPVAEITPYLSRLDFVQLPTLEYEFEIRINCPENQTATSLLVSVADTRKLLNTKQLAAAAPLKLALRIPADQIGPIAVEGFCKIEQSDSTDDTQSTPNDPLAVFRIAAALSAQASLRCESETDANVIYVSQALDVTLHCNRPVSGEDVEKLVDPD